MITIADPPKVAANIQVLFDTAQESGHTMLGMLSRVEQFALGGQAWALTEATKVRRWVELTPEAREQGEVAALAGLLERGAISVSAGGGPVLAPWLAIVAKARIEPTFLVVPDPGGHVAPGGIVPYGYAVLTEDLDFVGSVVELRSEAESEFRFVTPDQTAAGLANWLIATATDEAASAKNAEIEKPVSLQIIRHETRGPLTISTLAAQAATNEKITLATGKTSIKEVGISELACRLMKAFLTEAIITAISTETPTTETRESLR